MKRLTKKAKVGKKKQSMLSYRIKCNKTANGLSHYIPNEKKSLV